jgi:hypothetical protein
MQLQFRKKHSPHNDDGGSNSFEHRDNDTALKSHRNKHAGSPEMRLKRSAGTNSTSQMMTKKTIQSKLTDGSASDVTRLKNSKAQVANYAAGEVMPRNNTPKRANEDNSKPQMQRTKYQKRKSDDTRS